MTYHNILVHVDNSQASEVRAKAATSLAVRFESFLTGAFLKAEAAPAYAVSDAITMPTGNVDRYMEERAERIAEACHAARSMFCSVVSEAGLPFHWLQVNGDKDEPFIGAARRHDLVIMPPVMRTPASENTIAATDVAMKCGGPVLIVPPTGFAPRIGRNILVAWNDSRESARALRDAWPFLEQAEKIHFLIVSRQASGQLDEQLQRHLSQHACRAPKVIIERRDDLVTGNIISRRIGMCGADMAVLGLYGHSRFLEGVLGGVSRELLGEMPVPLLMSH